jgi:phosphate acetyltransferase
MSAIEKLIAKAARADSTVVLPEGQDPRVVAAANEIIELNIANVIVLGSEAEISASCAEAGISERKFTAIDYLNSEDFDKFAADFMALRQAKGKDIDMEKARKAVSSRIFYGAMMCRSGMVNGLVAGSISSTADMLRAAFMCIGTAPGIKIGSSSFLMDLKTPAPNGDQALLFADCGVNPDPNAEQLVDIATSAADTYRSLVGGTPKVAFLSFSTKGSAEHAILEKISAATALFKQKIADEGLDIIADGELQADAAIVPAVAASKAPESAIQGDANILIFPDLNAGNIAYKLTQRLAGAGAYGPILMGLNSPLNDLSRGCSADDIVGMAAVTVCQSLKG